MSKRELTEEQKEKKREYQREYKKQYYEKNKEKVAEHNKQYYEKNKEKVAEQQREYREKNKEKLAEHNKQYYEKNKEKLAEYQKQYYEKNKEKRLEYQRKYREKNKEKIAAQKEVDSLKGWSYKKVTPEDIITIDNPICFKEHSKWGRFFDESSEESIEEYNENYLKRVENFINKKYSSKLEHLTETDKENICKEAYELIFGERRL